MTSKIEFYREVLSDDPNSRVFFPLARMLAEQGDSEEAVSVLKRAIGFHSGHLEARFLLVELLSRLGREAEAAEAFEGLTSLLSNYPSVWSLWASKATGLSRDSSLALRFLALSLQGQDITWLGLMEQGLAAVSGQAGPSGEVQAGSDLESSEGFSLRGADEVLALTQQIEAEDRRAPADQLPPECVSEASATVKTRTMADLLARHGDYASALDIYAELLRLAATDGDKAALSARIDEIKSLMSCGTASAKPESGQQPKSKAKLVSMLETLATRLDARATA
ncbi:MAG: tetratricopeptide repeat protein [Acidobacteriota bacterium]